MPASLTVTPEPGNAPPRVRLQADVPAGNTGVSVLVMRHDPDGLDRPVRLADPATIAGTQWVGYDYEAPYGAPVTYSAVVQYGDPAVIQTTYNLVTNPSFETSISGWQANGLVGISPQSIVRSTAQFSTGAASGLITWAASAGGGQAEGIFVTGLTSGQSYVAQIKVRVPAGNPAVGFTVFGFSTTSQTTATDTWQLLTKSFTATGASHFLQVSPAATATAGQTCYVEDVMLSPGTVTPNYGDGNSAGWVWDGTVNLSSSRRPANSAGIVTDTATATTTVDVPDPWLVHPGVPSLSMRLASVKDLGTRTRPVNRGVFQPYGRRTPIAVTDGRRKAVQSQLTMRTRTLGEADALTDLLDDAAVLLLNIPIPLGWGVTSEYVSIGDVTEEREVAYGPDQGRIFTAPYMVVDRPVGGSQSQRTYADILAQFGTYQDVRTKYATYSELLAPTT